MGAVLCAVTPFSWRRAKKTLVNDDAWTSEVPLPKPLLEQVCHASVNLGICLSMPMHVAMLSAVKTQIFILGAARRLASA